MSLPQFAPFPDVKVRQNILPAEWTAYVDTWASLAELHLRLSDIQFRHAVTDDDSSLTTFLVSFFHELANDDSLVPQTLLLRKKCFFLLHRIYSADGVPAPLLGWSVLSDVCRIFSRSAQFRTLLDGLWKRKTASIEKSLQPAKNSLIQNLDSKRPEEAQSTLDKIAPLLRLSPQAGTYMITGSDFLDSLCNAYPKVNPPLHAKLATIAYMGLISLLEGPKPNFSVLSDHLYSLKANGEQQLKAGAVQTSLIADLVTNTPLLHKIRDQATTPEAARVRNFAASLISFQQSSAARPKKLVRRKVDKGKGKALDYEYGHGAFGEIHVHRMSMISQIQDLFPDLGSGFVVKLLDEYNENIEEVTAHLLEDSLPPHLANADRSEPLSSPSATKPHFTPRSTPPAIERRNVFDNDEFDRLAVDTSRLHIGRKNADATADTILSDRGAAPSKSAILSALAAFDSDDDERDDTYDVEDVGGTIDSATPGPDEADADLRDKNEEALFRAYNSTPGLFARDAETRRGKARAALKSETGMTDETIEGWGLMIGRDPKRLRRLEAKFSAFSGQQTQIASTSWRSTPAGSDTEGGEAGGEVQGSRGGRGGGRGRGRGRGRGGGGRGGGNVAGPTDDKGTRISRQRKEAGKGSRANHNRRDQRARKMARGGLPG
ncbi:uncharacterized protein CC84DRAFT_1103515 [Paraphaeosphaeria sporulosa]|uniref:CUE domain-containing protein n=1 Tax=Paraphaeosphaeria sporulosa TaxID=1460663 RepID=A0A177BYK4_9PLEO|nr:uncharacterized protein CC84DRAFT_1103515 [Paraphaeosphaeria sporulosa]OAF99711.1 hypothetical protein CC84DRAFT_1103515 [Paraphaeosphaeria sporulosa]